MNIYSQTMIINANQIKANENIASFLKLTTTRSDAIKYRYRLNLSIKN